MHKRPFTSSCDWIAYFYDDAQKSARRHRPDPTLEVPERIWRIIAGSLPAWQLGETSDGRHLRAAARQYAVAQDDAAFLSAVELFIREEQRHGAALGEWLDLAGIPRKRRDLGDTLFRLCRYAIPNYAVWASVVVMVESMAEIYYAAVCRLSPCPRLRAECEQILRDEVRHIQFQCEHLASARRHLPGWLRTGLSAAERLFYEVVCTAVWLAHGELLTAGGTGRRRFRKLAAQKFRITQGLIDPQRYSFSEPARTASNVTAACAS
jgi:hypothetical protein